MDLLTNFNADFADDIPWLSSVYRWETKDPPKSKQIKTKQVDGFINGRKTKIWLLMSQKEHNFRKRNIKRSQFSYQQWSLAMKMILWQTSSNDAANSFYNLKNIGKTA